MLSFREESQAVGLTSDLEAPLRTLEAQLSAMNAALRRPQDGAVERVAAELHAALVGAVDQFRRAARAGGVPPHLRDRLAMASAEVAAQREALARAMASLDRAIDVLMPRAPSGAQLYSSVGGAERGMSTGSLAA